MPPHWIDPGDLAACRALLRDGSRSFDAASRLFDACAHVDGAAVLERPAVKLVDLAGTARVTIEKGARERLLAVFGSLALDATAAPMAMVTHHTEEIPPGMTHAVLLSGGRILASGAIDEVLDSASVSECFGVRVAVGREAVAGAVLNTSPLSALLLTSMIEWFTQLHYVEHVRDGGELDELFRDILRFHWIDESRHARMDSLLIEEVAADLSAEQRDQALGELLQLGAEDSILIETTRGPLSSMMILAGPLR